MLVLCLLLSSCSDYTVAEEEDCFKNQAKYLIEVLKTGVDFDGDLNGLSVELLEASLNKDVNYHAYLQGCQMFGMAGNELKKFWPSKINKYTVHTGDLDEDFLGSIVSQAYLTTSNRLHGVFGFSLSSSIDIIFANNKETMKDIAKVHIDLIDPNYINKNFSNQYSAWCDDKTVASGVSFGDVILICINPRIENISNIEAGLLEIVTHELFHTAQTEMAGFSPLQGLGSDFSDTAGPAWLLEGSAVLFSRKNINSSLAGVQAKTSFTQPYIKGYDFKGDYSIFEKFNYLGKGSSFYLISERMVGYLVLKYGHKSLLEFYRILPILDNWQLAFYESFGISIGDFYKEINAELKE